MAISRELPEVLQVAQNVMQHQQRVGFETPAIWRGYTVRIVLAIAAYALAIVALAALQFIPGIGAFLAFARLRTGHGAGLVMLLLSFGFAVSAILLIPTGIRRGAVAVGILLLYPLSFGFNDIAALTGIGSEIVVPLRFLVPTAALCSAWLIARRRSPRSWIAFAVLVLSVPWNLLVDTIARAAGLAVSSTPDGLDPSLLDLGEGLKTGLTILLGLGVPVAAILIVAALLDHGRVARRTARAAARETELAALKALPRNDLDLIAVLALIFGFILPPLGPVLGYTAHQRIRTNGGRGWELATAGMVIGYIGIALWTTIWIVVALVVTGVTNGSFGGGLAS